MDLGRLLRVAASRPHVLVATMPGGTAVRLAVERELRLRGWPAAVMPSQADMLFVAGDVVPGLEAPVDEAEQAMAAPRARAYALRPDEVALALDTASRCLSNLDLQRDAALGTQGMSGTHDMSGTQGMSGTHDMSGTQGMSGTHDMGGTQGMSGMRDMGGMAMPAGLPMAERGDDRDGLRLDQLHVPLGPILGDWPAGLVLRVTLQGDVVAQARVETLAGSGPASGSWWAEPWRRASAGEAVTVGDAARRRGAAHLDSLGRFLAVAGWADASMAARRLRDDLLRGAAADVARRRLGGFARRVTRSWTLRWLTRGLGSLDAAEAAAAGVSGPASRAGGDVTARYRQWLAEIVDDAGRLDDHAPLDPTDEGPRGRIEATHGPSTALVDVLPRLLLGTELAAARLIVASLDPDLDELAPYAEVVPNG